MKACLQAFYPMKKLKNVMSQTADSDIIKVDFKNSKGECIWRKALFSHHFRWDDFYGQIFLKELMVPK